jgi:two-component system, chemotaxis family, response regulator Rcp1
MHGDHVSEVFLVDDNPADLDLLSEVIGRKCRSRITTAKDGEQALMLLRGSQHAHAARLPDMIVLDLNLPRKNGWAVLAEVKTDPVLKHIPVLVFTTSEAQHDINAAYELGANCYVSKPGNLKDFIAVVEALEEFWFSSAHLPRRVPA